MDVKRFRFETKRTHLKISKNSVGNDKWLYNIIDLYKNILVIRYSSL